MVSALKVQGHYCKCTKFQFNSLHMTTFLFLFKIFKVVLFTVSVLGRKEGYTVKYTPLPDGVPKGEAQGNF